MQNSFIIPNEVVLNKIYVFRGQKVMLDSDLAALYGVETKRVNEQVRRIQDRFPEDFMFQLSEEEYEIFRTQTITSKKVLIPSIYELSPQC